MVAVLHSQYPCFYQGQKVEIIEQGGRLQILMLVASRPLYSDDYRICHLR